MSESDWYLIDREGRRYGPYERELVDRLAQQRELAPSTPVWHPGLARWERADRVLRLPPDGAREAMAPPGRPAAAPAHRTAPARPAVSAPPVRTPALPVRKGAAPAAGAAVSGTAITRDQALRRVLAATLDACLVLIAYRVLLAFNPGRVPERAHLALPLVAWVLLDALFTHRQGATPGRALFAIGLRTTQGQPVEFPRALSWAAPVPVLLLAMLLRSGFLTFIAIAGVALAGARLRAGFAPWWDDVAGVRARYGELAGARRTAAIAALVVALLAAFISGVFP